MQHRTVVVQVAVVAFIVLAVLVSMPTGSPSPGGLRPPSNADSVVGARSVTVSPDGTLFVGSHAPGMVYAVPDRNGAFRCVPDVLGGVEGLRVVLLDGIEDAGEVLAFDDGEDEPAGTLPAPGVDDRDAEACAPEEIGEGGGVALGDDADEREPPSPADPRRLSPRSSRR